MTVKAQIKWTDQRQFIARAGNIAGERAEEYPKRYTDVHIEFVLHGKGIKPKAVEQAIALSTTKYCGAMASLNADVKTTYRIVDG